MVSRPADSLEIHRGPNSNKYWPSCGTYVKQTAYFDPQNSTVLETSWWQPPQKPPSPSSGPRPVAPLTTTELPSPHPLGSPLKSLCPRTGPRIHWQISSPVQSTSFQSQLRGAGSRAWMPLWMPSQVPGHGNLSWVQGSVDLRMRRSSRQPTLLTPHCL